MKMKIKLVSILILISIAFVGCNPDRSNPEKVAEEFARSLYTVDTRKIEEYNKVWEELEKNNPPSSMGIGIVSYSSDALKDLDKNIIALTTERAYKNLVHNRLVHVYVDRCAEAGYTLQITEVILEKYSHNQSEDKPTYKYEVKLKFISNDGKTEFEDTATGYIGLEKENGQWKVFSYRPQKWAGEFLFKY